jgi:DNA-directed RNA polymerase subunit omega
MIHPKIDELLDKVDSKYALVIAAARRTRQINDYHGQLGEGSFESFAPPLVESRSKNFLTMALEEIAAGQLVVTSPPKPKAKAKTAAKKK